MTMKKMFLAVLVVVLLSSLIFSGCSKPSPTPEATPAPAPAPTAAPVQPITLVFTTDKVAGDWQSTDILQPWFAEIEQRTGGRVKIEAHYNQELVKMPEVYNAVIKGTVDMGHFLPATTGGKFPLASVFNIPAYDNVGWRPARVQLELYNQFPEFQAEYQGTKPLLFYSMFCSYVGTTKQPIRKLEDGAGLKMIMADQIGAARAKALGWVPVSATPPEAFGMYQTGVADGGGVVTTSAIYSFKLGEVIHYVTMVPMGRNPLAVIMNIDKWTSLPPDVQKIMEDLTPEIVDLADKVQVGKHKEGIAGATKDYGTEFNYLPPEELARWVEVDKPVVASFIADLDAKGLPGQQYYDAYQQLEKKYSAPEYDFN